MLQVYQDGRLHTTSARYIATAAGIHGIPSFKFFYQLMKSHNYKHYNTIFRICEEIFSEKK